MIAVLTFIYLTAKEETNTRWYQKTVASQPSSELKL